MRSDMERQPRGLVAGEGGRTVSLMNAIPALVVAAVFAGLPALAADHAGSVVMEPLEVVDAEFTSVKLGAVPDGDGWFVGSQGLESTDGLLVEPDAPAEWWDGRVLQLPPRSAAVHDLDTAFRPGDRVMVSMNLRLADDQAAGGRLAVQLLGVAAPMNRMLSGRPQPVDGAWKRFFFQIEVNSGWPADAEPRLQIVNVGESPVFIDKVAVSKVVTDDAGFAAIFNGRDLTGWTGNTQGYGVEDGAIRTYPDRAGGNLYTEQEYDDFVFRFAFRLPPGANNGIAVRAPLTGDAAYEGMEIQVLENSHPNYAGLKPWQFHGSVYGISPALRGYQALPGEWNHEEIRIEGRKVRVVLNGKVINEVDLDEAMKDGTLSGREHPGAARLSGHIGFCGHGDVVEFKDLRLRPLSGTSAPSGR
jgi:hypothetical protein